MLMKKKKKKLIIFMKFGTELCVGGSMPRPSPGALMSIYDVGNSPANNSRSQGVAAQ